MPDYILRIIRKSNDAPAMTTIINVAKLSDKSLTEICSSFGDRDHATVIHAYEKIDKMRKEDKNFDKLLQQFEEQMRSF